MRRSRLKTTLKNSGGGRYQYFFDSLQPLSYTGHYLIQELLNNVCASWDDNTKTALNISRRV